MTEDNEVLEAYENITGLRVRDMNENEKQGILYSESDYPLGSKEVLGYKMAVDACGGIYNFEKLLPLMNVTFVHNGQLTIVPFPFKYLREYVKGFIS